MTTNDDNREQAVPCKICTTPTLMQGTKLCDRCYEIESRARLYPDDVEQVLNYLGWRVKTPAALLREAEAATAPDASEADGWYKKFTSWFGVNEYNKICHLLALKERPDCITEVAEYVFENAFSEYIAALRAARKREGEAVAENERLRKALRIFRGCAYPVSTEINPRGHDWRGEESLDYALSECEAALNEGAKNG